MHSSAAQPGSTDSSTETGLLESLEARIAGWGRPVGLVFAVLGLHTVAEQSASYLELVPQLPTVSLVVVLFVCRVVLAPILLVWLWKRHIGLKGYLRLCGLIALLGLTVFFLWDKLLRTPYNLGFHLGASLVWSLSAVVLTTAGAILLAAGIRWLEARGALSRDHLVRSRFLRMLMAALLGGCGLIALAWVARPTHSQGLEAILKPLRADTIPIDVLIIGNSLTYSNDLPGTLEALSRAAGDQPPLRVMGVALSGFTLEQHLDRGEASALIQSGLFEVIVLQENSRYAVHSPERALRAGRAFASEARAAGAKAYWFSHLAPRYYLYEMPSFNQHWAGVFRGLGYELLSLSARGEMVLSNQPQAPQQQPVEPRLWAEAYRALGEVLDLPVIPATSAGERALTHWPELALLREDGAHPEPAGTYLSALLMYTTLQGKNPEGLPAQVEVPQRDGRILQVGVPSELGAEMQRLAWETGQEGPPSALEPATLSTADSAYAGACMWTQLGQLERAAQAWQRYLELGGGQEGWAQARSRTP